MGLRGFQSTGSQSKVQGKLESDTLAALQHIRRVGRVARTCEKKGTAPDFNLECVVDFTVPSNGTLTTVRFIHVVDPRGQHWLEFQKIHPTTGAWEMNTKYQGISSLILCNDDDMDLPTGACPLLPLLLSQASTENNSVSRASRFFRYGLVGTAVGRVREIQINYQGAFFVRNPSPFGPNIFYQYGG